MRNVGIGAELNDFLDRFPECLAVAYADLSTGLVLASRSIEQMAQEKLDALCEIGRDCLLGENAVAVSQAFANPQQKNPNVAWYADSAGIKCFIKAPDPEVEAICLLVNSQQLSDGISSEAQHLLRRISAER
ncbi:MAG: hypothetical protein ABJ360_20105 [Roseobacter sp.]